MENVEAMGLERDLAGYPVLYVPAEVADPDPDEENYDELMVAHDEFLELITNIRRDEAEGLMLSSECDANGNRLYELKLLASSGMRQFNTNQIIMRYATAMATAIMGDFLLLGSGRQGSYALSETKARLFAQSIAALCDNICATINTDAVFELAELNPDIFEGLEKLPTVAHGHVEVPNLDTLANYLQKLGYNADLLKNDIELDNYLRGKADLPLRKDAPAAPADQGTQTQSQENADVPTGQERGGGALKLADMVPEKLAIAPDEEVHLAWLRLSQWFGAAKAKGKAVENIVNAAVFVMEEFKHRQLHIDQAKPLAQAVMSLKKSAPPVKIQIEANDGDGKLSALLNYIKHIGNIGHSFSIVVDPGDREHEKRFSWDGDGSDESTRSG